MEQLEALGEFVEELDMLAPAANLSVQVLVHCEELGQELLISSFSFELGLDDVVTHLISIFWRFVLLRGAREHHCCRFLEACGAEAFLLILAIH